MAIVGEGGLSPTLFGVAAALVATSCAGAQPTATEAPAAEVAGEEESPPRASDEAGGEDSDVVFEDAVSSPSGAVQAQPERPPRGSFELCGDQCRDNVPLKQSFEDDEAGESGAD